MDDDDDVVHYMYQCGWRGRKEKGKCEGRR